MMVLDASVLIAYLDNDDVHHARAVTLLSREIDDDFAANTVTLAEVLVAPARGQRLAAAREALNDLEVSELPFAADSAAKLAQLRADTNLKMPDCCVMHAAEDLSARIASFDARLAEAAIRLNLVVVTD